MPASPPSRRTVLLEAALDVIATAGMRGLTHRAVDRQAGLPEGSCSAYLRTRKALQLAAAEHLVGLLSADVAGLAAQIDRRDLASAEATALIVEMFQRWLADPRRQLARLELTLEGTRDSDIARVLATGRAELIETAVSGLAHGQGREVHRRVRTLVAALDGLMLGALPLPRRQRATYLNEGVGLLFEVLPEG